MDKVIQVQTTGESRDLMEKIGRYLVEQRLAACAQISGPIKSIYWWKDKLEETEEWVCLLKSTIGLYPRIEDAIRKIHPYEVPEIIVTGIERALPDYETWVVSEANGREKGARI
jgi:periplasmic divalent cation tolerance protein